MSERNKYTTIYLGEANDLIRNCILAEIREANAKMPESDNADEYAALKNRIAGIFGVTDRILAALNGEDDNDDA